MIKQRVILLLLLVVIFCVMAFILLMYSSQKGNVKSPSQDSVAVSVETPAQVAPSGECSWCAPKGGK